MADDKDIEDIKKLPPQERLKRLKELEDKRKKQEEEAKKIVEDSLKEIKLDEMLRQVDVPKHEKVDIDKLFQQAKDLGDQLEGEAKKNKNKDGGVDYAKRLQELLPKDTLQEIQGWYAQGKAPPDRREFLEVYESAREAYDVVRENMQARPNQELYSRPSQELVENVVESMRLLRSMGYKMKWFEPGQ